MGSKLVGTPSTTANTGSGASTPSASNTSGGGDVDLLRMARSQVPTSSSPNAVMQAYRAYRDTVRQPVHTTYNILGFLSSGTYGRVYKASLKGHPKSHNAEDERSGVVFAIKKFKPDKEEHATYSGLSQSAMREIALNRELQHENIITLREVTLEDKSIYMIFSYASHDLLQVIHHHGSVLHTQIALPVLKSILFQLLNGVHYLHSHFVLHRDLKPANILLTCDGVIKIADLGLARIYQAPLQSLYAGDKVVVTIWYRAPELLLGARHYNYKIDMWALGCIWGELLALRPMFKGEEAKIDPKIKATPFQVDQFNRIIEVLGNPTKERWPGIEHMPDHKSLWPHLRVESYTNNIYSWYTGRARTSSGFELFENLLQYDPSKRLSAEEALDHAWFKKEPLPTANVFASLSKGNSIYPARKLINDDSDPKMVPLVSSVAQIAAGGGTSNIIPGASGIAAAGGGSGSKGNAIHHSSFPIDPSAPPPAPASGGSVGSVDLGHTSTSNQSITQQATASIHQNKGGMVATATANAGRAAKRQKKA